MCRTDLDGSIRFGPFCQQVPSRHSATPNRRPNTRNHGRPDSRSGARASYLLSHKFCQVQIHPAELVRILGSAIPSVLHASPFDSLGFICCRGTDMLPYFELETGFGTRSRSKDAQRRRIRKRRTSCSSVMIMRERVNLHPHKLGHRTAPFTGVVAQRRYRSTALTFGDGVDRYAYRIHEHWQCWMRR
jgi:hypothetical protein